VHKKSADIHNKDPEIIFGGFDYLR